MAVGLFDHIKQITNVQNPKYWDTLEEQDKKTFSNYMVLRFLSMKYEWVETIAAVQPYLQEVPPKAMYLALIDLLPKGRHFMKYMKPKGANKYENWFIKRLGFLSVAPFLPLIHILDKAVIIPPRETS